MKVLIEIFVIILLIAAGWRQSFSEHYTRIRYGSETASRPAAARPVVVNPSSVAPAPAPTPARSAKWMWERGTLDAPPRR